MIEGNAESRCRLAGNVFFEIASMAAAFGGAGASKAGKAGDYGEAAGKLAKGEKLLDDAADLAKTGEAAKAAEILEGASGLAKGKSLSSAGKTGKLGERLTASVKNTIQKAAESSRVKGGAAKADDVLKEIRKSLMPKEGGLAPAEGLLDDLAGVSL